MKPPSDAVTPEPPCNRHPPWVVAVTGGIGSGKSTVALTLAQLGARVIDADAMAREETQRAEVLEEIQVAFGASVFDSTKGLDRAALAALVFGAPERLAILNRIVHPLVRDRIDKELAKWREKGFDSASPLPDNRPLVVLDIPLLERSPFARTVSSVIFVEAPLPDRIRRVVRERGWTADDLQRREAHQADLSEKRASADHVIDNSEPASPLAPDPTCPDNAAGALGHADLRTQCLRLIEHWQRLLRQDPCRRSNP
ncbi:MAG: dephospho-CoA kinase [Planctomycetota bacterium]